MDNFQNMISQLQSSNRYAGGINNMYAPHYDITQVNGRAGAENFRMGPNSKYLLLDTTAPIVWLVTTDGSGLLSAFPYDYTPHVEPVPVDVNALANEIQQLKEELANVRESNARYNKQSKKQQQQQSNTDGTNSAS